MEQPASDAPEFRPAALDRRARMRPSRLNPAYAGHYDDQSRTQPHCPFAPSIDGPDSGSCSGTRCAVSIAGGMCHGEVREKGIEKGRKGDARAEAGDIEERQV